MALNVLSTLLSPASLKVVNTVTGLNAFPNLKVLKAALRFPSTNMHHMREDGASIVDCRVIQPSMIVIDAICPDDDTVLAVNNVMADRSALYNVTSKGIVIQNMMIDNEDFKQSPEVISAAPVRLRFTQLLVEGVEPVVCAQQGDSSMLDRGIQLISQSPTTVLQLAGTLGANIRGLLG